MVLSYLSCVILNEKEIKIKIIIAITLLLFTVSFNNFFASIYNESVSNKIRQPYMKIVNKVSNELKILTAVFIFYLSNLMVLIIWFSNFLCETI